MTCWRAAIVTRSHGNPEAEIDKAMIVPSGNLLDRAVAVDSLLEQLELWAQRRPRQVVYTFRGEEGEHRAMTYEQLAQAARGVAGRLQQSVSPGARALLLYPPGLDFIIAFYGCLYAGVVAVPTCYPKPRRPMPRLSAIAADARAAIVLTDARTGRQMEADRHAGPLGGLPWLATDVIDPSWAARWTRPAVHSDTLALLQYTSGSTSDPKGVVLSHHNLLHNLEAIRRGFDIELTYGQSDPVAVGVFWLPAYHDMGLIGGILTPMYVGGQSYLMSPRTFMQRPARWLRAIDQHRASISGAPNFAYQLCAEKTTPAQSEGLDLSCWRVAFCGAEPIQARTLDGFASHFARWGFRRQAFYPCYGLAECSLLAAGGEGPGEPVVKPVRRDALRQHRVVASDDGDTQDVQRLVSCGRPAWRQKIAIVDPATSLVRGPGQVGEIWIQGPSNAQGYWGRVGESAATFRAYLADSDEGPYLRTGDLGFLDQGQLYVTGRVKDVVILRGRNHYPQDIESTVGEAHAALVTHGGAAFSIDIDGEERLVVLHEVDRAYRHEDWARVVNRIRRAIVERHEVEPYAVVLPRQASLPRTTSGKIQRRCCRQLYLDGQLKVVHQWVSPANKLRVDPGGHAHAAVSTDLASQGPLGDRQAELFSSLSQNPTGQTGG
jgi:acyl-CoA synthetase (AMP-forming)/AMP-acid ligase II